MAAAALLLPLPAWWPYAVGWCISLLSTTLSTAGTLTQDVPVVLDPATGRHEFWVRPMWEPESQFEYADLRRRASRGEISIPARYEAVLSSKWSPIIISSNLFFAPMWYVRRFEGGFITGDRHAVAPPTYLTPQQAAEWREEFGSDDPMIGQPWTPPESARWLETAAPGAIRGAIGSAMPHMAEIAESLRPGSSDRVIYWPGVALNSLCLIVIATGLRLAWVARRNFRLAEALRPPSPHPDSVCPRCGYPVTMRDQPRCSECGVTIGRIAQQTVFVFADGELTIYPSIPTAQQALPAERVRAGAYEAFTARGGFVDLRVTTHTDAAGAAVHMHAQNPTSSSCDQFVRMLNRALKAAGATERYRSWEVDHAAKAAALVIGVTKPVQVAEPARRSVEPGR